MTLAAAALVTAIVHVTVIDATGAAPRANQTVIIRNGRIAKIGSIPAPKDASIIEGSGKYLIPGLWDMHSHAVAHHQERFEKLRSQGITGIRNMHTEAERPFELVRSARKEASGPRVVASGQIVDGMAPVWPASIIAGDAAMARQAVALLSREGADFIKPYDMLRPDVYFALAKAGRRRKLPIMGHVPVFVTAREAVDAGHRSIEHLSSVFEACTERPELENELRAAANLWTISRSRSARRQQAALSEIAATYDSGRCQPLFQIFVQRRVWHCPTLVAMRHLRSAAMQVVGDMHRAGVRLLAGTDDAGDLSQELALMVEAGLTPMAALQTATRNPAELLGLRRFGTIQKGKAADLVLLDANPLEDMANLKRVAAVFFDGRMVYGLTRRNQAYTGRPISTMSNPGHVVAGR